MKYLAVLGRQPEISLAELESLFSDVKTTGKFVNKTHNIVVWAGPDIVSSEGQKMGLQVRATSPISIEGLGGVLKLAIELEQKPLDFLAGLPDGKITLGISDYSRKASKKTAATDALKLKRILARHGRSVRVVENKDATLSTATSIHNGLSGKNERKIELIKVENEWFRVIGVQDIDAYSKRDQSRPARDARVGMLPPKLAQILINLCGPLGDGATLLDPFCGTGVVLQEALLMGYKVYGTDINERMVEYTGKNLKWLSSKFKKTGRSLNENDLLVEQGDATSHKWKKMISAVACEGYLGQPMSLIPTEIKLKAQKQECGAIVLGFLKNLSSQIERNTPVTIAVPAWLRESGEYSRLDILDEIKKLGYNVNNKTREGLLYHRKEQIVARDILILRKK